MKIKKVGSPIVADYSHQNEESYKEANFFKKKRPSDINYSRNKFTQDRRPIITPPIEHATFSDASDGGTDGQQYLLVPNRDKIRVLSMEHGQLVTELVPYYPSHRRENTEGDKRIDNNKVVLNTVEIVKIGRSCRSESNICTNDAELSLNKKADLSLREEEWVVIAGFTNGTIQEWPLSFAILSGRHDDSVFPSRIFELPSFGGNTSISHVTCPVEVDHGIFFTLVSCQRRIDGDNKKLTESHLCRIVLPQISHSDGGDCQIFKLKEEFNRLALFSNDEEEKIADTVKHNFVKHQVHIPFLLLSSSIPKDDSSSGKKSSNVLITIVNKRGFTVYYDQLKNFSRTDDNFVSFTNSKKHSDITTAAISPNWQDMALGLKDGSIEIYVSVLKRIITYVENKILFSSSTNSEKESEHGHPQKGLLIRRLHWHPLPVKTLCYMGLPGSRAEPNLLSGGEEDVMLTWNVDRGELFRPVHTFPRLTKSCITHIATNKYSGVDCEEIVIRCMGNSLQLIQGHNYAIRWRNQGLASPMNECVPPVKSKQKRIFSAILRIDWRTQMPILSRLSGAPGFVHWFNPCSGQVVGELEVSAYNRISRKSIESNSNPRPTVTHLVLCDSGYNMITVDTMLTENSSMGCEFKVALNNIMSLVTNIKFWAWCEDLEESRTQQVCGKGMPYELIAAMPSPHGMLDGDIDALAITRNGSTACSMSIREGAFHIWRKTNEGLSSNTPPTPAWKRDCKISIPAGHSNTPSNGVGKDGNSAISFSSDGSVLAIAFGRHVTLWDHSNVTILNTVCGLEHIRDLQFMMSPRDMLLAIGNSSISTLPPYGGGYTGNSSWCYKLPAGTLVNNYKLSLGLVSPLVSRKEIATAIIHRKGSHTLTKIVLLDAASGNPMNFEDGAPCCWSVNGCVVCMCDISMFKNEWSNEEAILLVLTDEHEMFVLETEATDDKLKLAVLEKGTYLSRIESKAAPALTSSAPAFRVNKIRRMNEPGIASNTFRDHHENTGGFDFSSFVFDSTSMAGGNDNAVPSNRLPALSSAFTSAFISRRFRREQPDDPE